MKRTITLILAVLMLTGIFAVIPASAAAYSDVRADRWSVEDIRYASDNGYMQGVGGGKFDPEGTMTRAMVVTVLFRMEGEPTTAYRADFRDVAEGQWYALPVIWAKDSGVVLGVSADRFDPEGKITREQLTTMLYRYSSYKDYDLTGSADLSSFPDKDKISDWAADSLSWAVDAGLVKGTDGGRLSPDGDATREQFAAILHRFDDKFAFAYKTPVLFSTFTEKDYPLVDDADFYVSANGSDDADGSLDHPFATFNRAVEAVRGIEKTAEKGGIKVAFKAGDYGPLAVALTAADGGTPECPVTYCKYGDGDVTFNDGYDVPASDFAPISGEEQAMFREKARTDVYVADVSGKIGGYTVNSLVFSDSGEMTVARYPNKYDDNTDNLLLKAATTTSVTTMRMLNVMLKNRIKTYHTLDGLKMYGFLTFGWYKETLSIADYDFETGDFYVPDHAKARSADWTGGLRYETDGSGEPFFKDDVDLCLLNVSEELDAKGEYWIDAANSKMYVYGEPENYHIIAGAAPMISGTADCVSIIGLDFYNSDYGFIEIDGDGVTVDGCVFSGCGSEFGVHISIPEDANGGNAALGTTVRNSEFSSCAGNGLFIDGCRRGANIAKRRSNVTVDNNYFAECNLREANTGALRLLVSGAHVSHNYFYSTAWEGMDYRGTAFLTAEYNVFERICYNGDDTGAVNSYDGEEAEGNVIRNNLFLAGTGGTVGRYCAYLDNSCGTEFCYNLIYDCAIAVMSNGNRNNSIHHNLIVNPTDSPASITIKDEGTKAVLEAGATGDFSVVTNSDNYKAWKSFLQTLETNEEWHAAVEANMPWLLDLTYDLDRWAEPGFVLNAANDVYCNVAISASGKGFEFKNTVTDYGEYHDNVGYMIDEDPIFVDPTNGDYRVREGVGFDGFRFDLIGRY